MSEGGFATGVILILAGVWVVGHLGHLSGWLTSRGVAGL